MDGVLIDSQPLHYQLDIRVLKSCGYNATLDTVTPYTGLGNPDRWPKYKKDLNLAESTEQLIAMAEQAMRDIFNETTLVASDGIPSLLQALKDNGMHIGVASSSSHELIELVLMRTGISHFFDKITSGEDVTHGKPAPDIYLTATQKAGLQPHECFAIEDAPAGILSAKNAGLTCIAYKNPNTANQVFDNASYIVSHFDECMNIIGGSAQ